MLLASVILAFFQAAPVWTARYDPPPPPNIVLIIADDIGIENISAYGWPQSPQTPNIDALGHRIGRAYAMPSCSITRATILRGIPPHVHGVTHNIGRNTGEVLPVGPNIATDLNLLGYSCYHVGKWHLGGDPRDHGFEETRGCLWNLVGTQSYYSFPKQNNGVEVWQSDVYMTSDEVDDAIALASKATGPWFIWLAFHAPHHPLEAPPAHLVSDPDASVYHQMIQAMDAEIGRLRDSLPPDTEFIFVGDNGTNDAVVMPPFDPQRAKGTVYEGGTRVPMFVSSASAEHVVSVVQLREVVTSIARGRPRIKREDYVGAEISAPNFGPPWHSRHRMIRDHRWKLIRRYPGSGPEIEFFDMSAAPFNQDGESLPLGKLNPVQHAALLRLLDALDEP